MDLGLTRVDLLQVSVTHRKTTKLLPSSSISEKSPQKVAVGDREGVLQVFSCRKGEILHTFKTLPGPEITRVELGGAIGTIKDKIFTASGKDVRGYTKKGKLFLDFDTNLTEPIGSMSISGSHLLTCGAHVYNHYLDCRDTDYYVCEDSISDVLALPGEKVKHLTPVLACHDRSIRVLRDSTLMYNVELPGPPSCLALFYNDGGENGDEVLYGTEDGKIGLLQLTRTMGPATRWLLNPETTAGAVQSLDNYDISGDGVKDLIVGRHDGSIEVYSYDEGDESEPILKYSHNCGESVSSVEGGVVGSAGFDEIIATTYTGWVFGLTTENVESRARLQRDSISSTSTSATTSSSVFDTDNAVKIKLEKLRRELDIIQSRVVEEREKYHQASQSQGPAVSAIPSLNINDRFTLSQSDASYLLSIELETPIENVLLQSDCPVDLLDVEKNSAVVSYSACDQESGNILLATYRCQANTTRLEIKIRTIEGQYGTLLAYITPRLQPKCCQVQEYKIKPLSLHMRTHRFDHQRPCNTLRLSGPFSMAEMHTWISFCLPEVPEKPPATDDATFIFMSTFLDTMLQVDYRKGEAIFKSDNISTMSILKDFLTKEATKKKISLDISCDVNDDSVIHALKLLYPKLENQLLLAKQVALIEALKDLASHEEDTSFFAPEYLHILNNAETLMAEFKRQPAKLERLYGMVTDLFIDQHKFKGQNVKSKVSQLLDILDKYGLDTIIDFFTTN